MAISARRIIITGASSGIGQATARLLAADGHSFVLAARREKAIHDLAAECLHLGASGAVPVPCDVTSYPDCQKLNDAVRELGTDPIVLINNAGVADMSPFHTQSILSVTQQIEANLLGTLYATHAVINMMLEQGGGQVLNVLSIAAMGGFPGGESYSASKAGARAFSQSLAASYRKQGIRVTSVCPGATDTPIWDGAGWKPAVEDMLPAIAIAETLRDLINLPQDRNIDEIVVMPPKGLL
ncbi:MAG: SDR family oxidoreductase [Armatimonadetes bacterium]|nr:SDR family oxidoreductase [Armatimonadota bacterium]